MTDKRAPRHAVLRGRGAPAPEPAWRTHLPRRLAEARLGLKM